MTRYHHRGGQMIPFTAEEEAEFDAMAAETAATIHAEAIARVKAEAQRRIYARYPQTAQANMTARGVELAAIRVGLPGEEPREWTQEEAAEAQANLTAFAWIKAVRTASDAIEAEVPAGADAYGFDPVNRPEWPE